MLSPFVFYRNNELIASANGVGVYYQYRDIDIIVYRDHKLMDIFNCLLTEDSDFLQFYDSFMRLDKAMFSQDIDEIRKAIELLEPYRNFLDERIEYAMNLRHPDPHIVRYNNLIPGRKIVMFGLEFLIIGATNYDKSCDCLYKELSRYIVRGSPTFSVSICEFLSYMI